MSDLQRLRRYHLQEGDGEPNSDLAELIGDIHWAADEIDRLRSALDEIYHDPGNGKMIVQAALNGDKYA